MSRRKAMESPHLLPLWPAALAAALDRAFWCAQASTSLLHAPTSVPLRTGCAALLQPICMQHCKGAASLTILWDAGRAGSGSSNPSRPAAQQSPLLPANQPPSILCARTRCCRRLSKPPAGLQPAAQRTRSMQQRTRINGRPCSCCTVRRLLRRRCLPRGQPQRIWLCVH